MLTLFSLLFVTLCSPSFYFCYTFLRLFSPFVKENDIGARAGLSRLPASAGGRAWECRKIRVTRPRGLCRVFTLFPTCFTCSLFHLAPALFTFYLPLFCLVVKPADWASYIATVLFIPVTRTGRNLAPIYPACCVCVSCHLEDMVIVSSSALVFGEPRLHPHKVVRISRGFSATGSVESRM